MSILPIAILSVAAVLIGQLPRFRGLGLLAISALAIFWLQPEEPFPFLQFWLPFATLAITALSWAVTSAPDARGWHKNWAAFAVLTAVVLLAGLTGVLHSEFDSQINVAALPLILAGLMSVVVLCYILLRWQSLSPFSRVVALCGIVLLLIVLKSPFLMHKLVLHLAALRGEDTQGPPKVIGWLGYSYVAFRLMHTIRDRQSARLPSVTLGEYVNYVIFFPSFTAGPIDRIERFVADLRTPPALADEDWLDAGSRLFGGLFKKFVIADLLAVISLNDVLVTQIHSTAWLWIVLYAYAFRIFFDFSGYTDIAIGIARLARIRLPENFARPYLKPSLTEFWNSWHITLTQWFRAYFFNPLIRAMRSGHGSWPTWLMILLAQSSTMLLIGLWHGINLNFAAWGIWHGLGLFIHNRWSEFLKPRSQPWMQTRAGQSLLGALGILLTFHYVAIGWVFFVLSTPALAWVALLHLFGLAV